jgi:hypothetical protein
VLSSAAVGERGTGRRVTHAAPQAGASMLVRALEGVHLSTQMLLPALGSLGLIVVYGDLLLGKLLMFGWLPILVFQLVDFAHHRSPRSTTAALSMALAVPGELAVTHALSGDTPLLFFTDLFLVELVGLLIALPLFAVAEKLGQGGDREGIAALIVLASIGVPLIVWVVVPFWTGRSDDPLWLAGLLLGVLLGVVTRYNAMRGGPVGGDQFATPWMVRGFVLWVVAIIVARYAL